VLQENFATARRLYRKSRALYREINDKGGLATALAGLARSDCALGDYRAAQRHLHQALQLAAAIRFTPLIFSLLLIAAAVMRRTGRAERGLFLLAFIRAHPGADQKSRDEAARLLERDEPAAAEEFRRRALAEGRAADLTTMTEALLADLASPPAEAAPAPPAQAAEPLTDREQDVLRLIAQGMTNQEVADELVISVGTVKWYTSQIYGKLDVGNRTEAAARARDLGLLAA
jgi:LuxR family maltose regulon positive regulatory protein